MTIKRAADLHTVMAAITEHGEQSAVCEYLQVMYPNTRIWSIIFMSKLLTADLFF